MTAQEGTCTSWKAREVNSGTSIFPKPVLEALQGHLNGRDEGYVFEGRDMDHISTRQIQRLLDGVAERAGLRRLDQAKYVNGRGSHLIC